MTHITNGCKLLAAREYTDRHNLSAKIIHQALANKHQLSTDNAPYYQYTPQTVLENTEYKLYWDQTIYTDKTIIANRPDIVLMNKRERTTYLIDIAIPSDTNIQQKYNEKIQKYTDLAIEIQRIWNQQKVQIIPLIVSATGITPSSFTQNLTTLDLPHTLHKNFQKSVIIKTAHGLT